MAVALVLAGQMGGSLAAPDPDRLAVRIAPNAVDYVRAVQEGLTFPAADLARDAAIAIARREVNTVEAGFALNVTESKPPEALAAVAEPSTNADQAGLPQTIVQSEGRIERPSLKSKTGETIIAGPAAVSIAYSVAQPGGSVSASFVAEPANIDVGSALLDLAREAHQRTFKPAMSAQAMSEYLSLYALRERVEAIGDSLALTPDAPVGGAWVANLGGSMDDVLFQDGMGFGQAAFGSVAGFDAVSQNILSDGDHLVYGGFVSAYGTSPQDEFTFSAAVSETRGGSAGLFAVLSDGPFSLSAMVRADLARTFDATAANRLDFSDTMQVLKAEVVARYRFDLSDWSLEPSAGVAFASGRRELVGLSPVTPRVEDAESLKIQLGVKASGVVYNRAGTSVEPSVTIMISEELRDQGDVTFLSGAPTGPSDPIKGKTVGAVSFGVDVKDESGWSGFVRADGQVSDDDKPSAGVSAGVKAQW